MFYLLDLSAMFPKSSLQVDYTKLADRIMGLAGSKECYSKNRKDMYNIVKT